MRCIHARVPLQALTSTSSTRFALIEVQLYFDSCRRSPACLRSWNRSCTASGEARWNRSRSGFCFGSNAGLRGSSSRLSLFDADAAGGVLAILSRKCRTAHGSARSPFNRSALRLITRTSSAVKSGGRLRPVWACGHDHSRRRQRDDKNDEAFCAASDHCPPSDAPAQVAHAPAENRFERSLGNDENSPIWGPLPFEESRRCARHHDFPAGFRRHYGDQEAGEIRLVDRARAVPASAAAVGAWCRP